MLEIVFSESACGALKLAQRYGEGKYRGGATGVIVRNADGSTPSPSELDRMRREAQERERRAWERAVPLGGQRADVFCFDLALSVGGVAPETFWHQRRAALCALFRRWGEEERREELDRRLPAARAALETVRARFNDGADLRIWHSQQPDEACGLRWLLAALSPWREGVGNVFLVRLPVYVEDADDACVYAFTGWGEVPVEHWGRLAGGQKAASPRLCAALASEWRDVEAENAPLRALVGGRVRSVPETLYDGCLRRALDSLPETFPEARLIGNALCKHAPGVSDGLLALRVEAMLRAGELTVESASPGAHRRLLRKGKTGA